MLYVVEIPHQRKSFAWRTESRESYCQIVQQLNRSGEEIYEESTFEELAETYGVDLKDVEAYERLFAYVFGDAYKYEGCPPTKIYKHYSDAYWTDEAGSEFDDCCAKEALDLYNYYVFEGEQEAIEGLRSLVRGHNGATAFKDLFDLLMEAGYAAPLSAVGFTDKVFAHTEGRA